MLAMSHASLARVFASLDARRRPARAVARRQSGGLSCRAVVGDDARDDTARANAPSRRAFVHMLSLASVASVVSAPGARAEEDDAAIDGAAAIEAAAPPTASKVRELEKKRVVSESLAYEFTYAVEAESGKPISWAVSRERDTYSSAEPMSPNARQRIVYELLSFKGPLTTVVTVSNTPPALESKAVKEWTAKQVANAVLADKATGRVASGQRVSLAEVDNAIINVIDDVPYYYYEYISQGSPNLREPEATTFRHSYGVTVERDGYLYTLSSSAPEIYWDELARGFDETIKSFRLTTPNKKKYRAPGNEGLGISLPFQ